MPWCRPGQEENPNPGRAPHPAMCRSPRRCVPARGRAAAQKRAGVQALHRQAVRCPLTRPFSGPEDGASWHSSCRSPSRSCQDYNHCAQRATMSTATHFVRRIFALYFATSACERDARAPRDRLCGSPPDVEACKAPALGGPYGERDDNPKYVPDKRTGTTTCRRSGRQSAGESLSCVVMLGQMAEESARPQPWDWRWPACGCRLV